mgnify:CR=1 FL=1
MKYIYFAVLALLFASCNCGKSGETVAPEVVLPEGEFTYNLPCKVVNINTDKPGKAILLLWLHGGVHDRPKHDMFYHPNHFDCCDADEYILQYLKDSGTKAIALFPVCYKSNLPNTIKWKECYDDVKSIIDDYANKGLIDTNRIYVTGSSDGGRGTWDYAEMHPEVFAAGISMSCAQPRIVNIPMYFFSTGDEGDCTEAVAKLVEQGADIKYKYCADQVHGGDAIECTPELLKEFFSHTK